MTAVRHLGFLKTWFLSSGWDFPSGYQIWCKNVDRRQNYGQKSKFKMAAVRHLGILISPYRITHEVFSLGYISLSNFVIIRYIVLKIKGFEFSQIGLKCLFRPQNFGFGGLDLAHLNLTAASFKCKPSARLSYAYNLYLNLIFAF